MAWFGASRSRSQRGTSLIEVLIAVLLMSVGLLGMVRLKAASLKYTGQSNARATASMHAADMMDRLRANPVRAVGGQYNLAIDAAAPVSPNTVAGVDLLQWRVRIAESLPAGSGSVAVATDSTVRLVLRWSERSEQSSQSVQLTYTFEARL